MEVSGYGGYEWRGGADGFDIPGGAFRWGTGLTFPSRNALRVVGELNGFVPSKDVATTSTALVGIDGSHSPLTANTENITRATLGLTLQTKKGLFFGAGLSWNADARPHQLIHRQPTSPATTATSGSDHYHPGVKVTCRRAPPTPTPAAIPAPMHNLS